MLSGIKYYTADRDIPWDPEDDNFFLFVRETKIRPGEYTSCVTKVVVKLCYEQI